MCAPLSVSVSRISRLSNIARARACVSLSLSLCIFASCELVRTLVRERFFLNDESERPVLVVVFVAFLDGLARATTMMMISMVLKIFFAREALESFEGGFELEFPGTEYFGGYRPTFDEFFDAGNERLLLFGVLFLLLFGSRTARVEYFENGFGDRKSRGSGTESRRSLQRQPGQCT